MVDQAIIEATAARLAALDFSAENARIAELEAEMERMSAAERKANQRRAEINDEIASLAFGPHGSAVADALLADSGDLATVSPSRETLENESAALARGANELVQRIAGARRSIDSVRNQAKTRLTAAARDLIDALRHEAEQAARRLVDCHAALEAVDAATGGGHSEIRATEMAMRGIFQDRGILQRARDGLVSVPAEIVALLETTADMGPAIRARLVTEVKPY